MKKLLLILLAALTLCALTAGSSFAAEGRTPINDEARMQLPAGDAIPKSSFSIKKNGSLTTGSDVTFSVKGGKVTSLKMAITRPWDETGMTECVYVGNNISKFTYHFMEPGTYYFFVNEKYVDFVRITGTDLLAKRIKKIMSQCKATGEYEIALWAHDWLTLHTYYDNTLVYHGPDYLLSEDAGWGVCQSYATAYYNAEIKGPQC